MFWRVWNARTYQLPSETEICYEFTVVSPYHRCIVNYLEDDIYLTAAYSLQTETSLDITTMVRPFFPIDIQIQWKLSSKFEISVQEAQLQVQQLNPFKHKGFLIIDQDRYFSFHTI